MVLGFNSSGSYGSSGRGSGSYGASGNGSASLYADMDENDGGAPPLDTSTQLYQVEEREKERNEKEDKGEELYDPAMPGVSTSK